MSDAILEIRAAGLGMTIQDAGRPGWKRFGLPPSGAMDPEAAFQANALLNNSPDAPVLEMLYQGGELRFLEAAWIALTGADATPNAPMWRAVRAAPGDCLRFPRNVRGVWIYLAVDGGFASPRWLGSASSYPRAGIGSALEPGARLSRDRLDSNPLPAQVAGRWVAPDAVPDYSRPPSLRVWPGPQWDQFEDAARAALFEAEWTVSSRSDRTGYRLEGPRLGWTGGQIVSQPMRVGSIQAPSDGQPIVIMPDGPTVGGYPKIGWVASEDLRWLAQSQPGRRVRFQSAFAPRLD